jgi:hypothetical protein
MRNSFVKLAPPFCVNSDLSQRLYKAAERMKLPSVSENTSRGDIGWLTSYVEETVVQSW